MASWTFVFIVSNFVAIVTAGGPAFPKSYHVKGTIILPFNDIVEPFEAWVDAGKGMSRIDFYGGTAQLINRGDVGQYGTMFQIVYVTTKTYTNKKTCFAINGTSDGKVMAQGVFPDISSYILHGTLNYQGVETSVWEKESVVNTKSQEYTVLVNKATKMPVIFRFIGYDDLFGSHFDEYVLEYDSVDTSVDQSVFDIYKSMSCGSFLGPGSTHVMHTNPMFELVGSPDHDSSTQSAQLDEQFDQFKQKHNKQYKDEVEHEVRKTHFRHNLRFIDSTNRQKLTYSLGVNHLTDRSDDELKIMRGYRPSKDPKGGNVFTSDVTDVPEYWNWRLQGAVSPIKDQGICGSCWSFGTTGTIEGAYFIKHKKMVRMSEQELVDCSWGYGNYGCAGGETFRAYQWIMDNKCIAEEDGYGQYLQQDGYCHNTNAPCGASLTGYKKIPTGNLTALRIAVATQGPVAVAIDASLKSFSFYAFGVYYDQQCGNKEEDLDHSVLAVGYGTMDGQDYWLIKNSWSTHWGNDGYVLMSQKDNNCGVATDADFAQVQ